MWSDGKKELSGIGARRSGASAFVGAAMTASGNGMNRRDAIRLMSAAVCGLVVGGGVKAVGAASMNVDEMERKRPKKGGRGSKEAKGYQLCLSQCLYDCTTPRAGMAKERSECRVECKDECAVSREQL